MENKLETIKQLQMILIIISQALPRTWLVKFVKPIKYLVITSITPKENSFAVSPVLEVEVSDQINNLDETKAPDCYDVPAKLIKAIQGSIVKPLTDIINTSSSTGYYPKALKFAKVLPIFKANSPHEASNYCSISL